MSTARASVQLLNHARPYNANVANITRPDWVAKHELDTGAHHLLPYVLEPEKWSNRVLRITPDIVLIKDKYPKASVHLLLLPRWTPHRDYHPHDAFEDPQFLSMMRKEAVEGLSIASQRLRLCMHKSLQSTGLKEAAIETMLDKRDFSKDFQIGIHAHPSQHELHVHIISRDMISNHKYSPRHYQSFNTHFLVPLKDYPLPSDDLRRAVQFQNDNLMKDDFQCWKCGKDYGMDYDRLQVHLRQEWLAWIEEGTTSVREKDLPTTTELNVQMGTKSTAINP